MKDKWYSQSTVWLIVLLPLAAVTAGITTFIIANNNKVELVAEDYYKKGKAINADLSKLDKAKELGITAALKFQGQDGIITIATGQTRPGQALKLSLFHTTLKDQDVDIILSADASGNYRFSMEKMLKGKWQVRLGPMDELWRIQEQVIFPTDGVILDGKF